MEAPDFWDNPKKSAPLLRKRRGVEKQRDTLVRLRRDADDLTGWRELLAEGEVDEEAISRSSRAWRRISASSSWS